MNLSKIIEVSPRSIRTYKEDLEKAGVFIDTIYGKYGGYSYSGNSYDLNLNTFSLDELGCIENINRNKSKLDLSEENNQNLEEIVNKIRCYTIYISNNKKKLNGNELNHRYNQLKKMINNKEKITLKYRSRSGKIKTVNFIPHDIYNYNNDFFVTGLVIDTNQIRTYSFSEIKEII